MVSDVFVRVCVVVESLQSLQWRRGFRRIMTYFGRIDEFRPESEFLNCVLVQMTWMKRKGFYFSDCDRRENPLYIRRSSGASQAISVSSKPHGTLQALW